MHHAQLERCNESRCSRDFPASVSAVWTGLPSAVGRTSSPRRPCDWTGGCRSAEQAAVEKVLERDQHEPVRLETGAEITASIRGTQWQVSPFFTHTRSERCHSPCRDEMKHSLPEYASWQTLTEKATGSRRAKPTE